MIFIIFKIRTKRSTKRNSRKGQGWGSKMKPHNRAAVRKGVTGMDFSTGQDKKQKQNPPRKPKGTTSGREKYKQKGTKK